MKKLLMILLALALVLSITGVVSAEDTYVTYDVLDGYTALLPVNGVTLVPTDDGYASAYENIVGVSNAQISENEVLSIRVESANNFHVVAAIGNTESKVQYKAGILGADGEYSDISDGAEVLSIGIGDAYTAPMKFYTTTEWTKEAKISAPHKDTLTFTYEFITMVDVWDGTSDTSWYNEEASEFTLTSAEQIVGLAELVDGGNTFEGKTIKLDGNVDLAKYDENGNPVSFDPIGDKNPFKGTFDGGGNTISNLYQSGWAFGYEWGSYGSIGLFGNVDGATIKDVTISGAEVQIEGGDVGGIVGSATGTCVFQDIIIEDSDFGTYNNGIGGIIGWSGAGTYTFKNITIGSDVVLGGLWGSFDSSVGGIVGQAEPGATYNFENVDIACRLDVYNDCTASYDYYNYRMCGMIIGRLEETTTIDGTNYPDTSKYDITCKDVTVTYGDWANYHYCDPTPGYNNGRGMRVEPGFTYGGLPDDYDHSQCTTHHNELIPFDQIFGGNQFGVKGLKTYDGVTVIYK